MSLLWLTLWFLLIVRQLKINNHQSLNTVLEHTVKQKSKVWVQLYSHRSQKLKSFTGQVSVALSTKQVHLPMPLRYGGSYVVSWVGASQPVTCCSHCQWLWVCVYSETIPTGRPQLNKHIGMHYFLWEACVGTELRQKTMTRRHLTAVFSVQQLLCLMLCWGISFSPPPLNLLVLCIVEFLWNPHVYVCVHLSYMCFWCLLFFLFVLPYSSLFALVLY